MWLPAVKNAETLAIFRVWDKVPEIPKYH